VKLNVQALVYYIQHKIYFKIHILSIIIYPYDCLVISFIENSTSINNHTAVTEVPKFQLYSE